MISSPQHVFAPSVSLCFLIAESLFHGDFIVFYVHFDFILSFIFSPQQIVVPTLSSLLRLPMLATIISIASSDVPLAPIPVVFFFLPDASRSFVFSLQRVSSHLPVFHPLLLTLTPEVTRQVFIFRFEKTLPSVCVPLYAS